MRRAGDAGAWAAGLGYGLVGAAVLAALLADWLAPRDPELISAAERFLSPPGDGSLLGSDGLGRDMLSRLLHGARVSLLVAMGSVAGSVLLGASLGLAAGLGPRWLDRVCMAVTDLFLAFPRIFLVLMLVSLARPSLLLVVVVIAGTGWMSIARLVRAEVLSLREREFVSAARGLGVSGVSLARRHLLPHVLPVLIVAAALRIGNAILLESFLSYLGLGVQEPQITWGAMVDHGRRYLVDAWWVSALPGLAIALTVTGWNLLGDVLRDRLDPRRRRGGERDA